MLTVMLISFLAISLAFAGLATGVLLGRKPIKGSCGGLNQIGISGSCEVCGGDRQRCENNSEAADSRD